MKDVFMKNKILFSLVVVTAVSVYMGFGNAQAQSVPATAEEPVPVDFPQRSSLGEMKEAMLPSLTDSAIKDPSPMAVVVSKKASPSEQLLGRITSEVFHEMADLERGNVFLKLQTQREQLKNDLEKLKAAYRQARLDEIEKRENVIRTRVEWMQEQERIRQEILEKKMQTELLEKQIEEAEARKEALLSQNTKPISAATEGVQTTQETEEGEVIEIFPKLTILDIKGIKGKLTARLYGEDGVVFAVKVGTEIPSGYKVKSITKGAVVFEKDGKLERVEKTPMIIGASKTEEIIVEEELDQEQE